MTSSLRPKELLHLYESLSPQERDKLLQCLLYASTISGETVIQRLEEYLGEMAAEKSGEDLAAG